jgi:hypothetical protein
MKKTLSLVIKTLAPVILSAAKDLALVVSG